VNPARLREQWGVVMKTVTNFRVLQKTRTFLSSWVILLGFKDKHCIRI